MELDKSDCTICLRDVSGYVRRRKYQTAQYCKKKGSVMPAPSQYEKPLIAMFDSFGKTVARNLGTSED